MDSPATFRPRTRRIVALVCFALTFVCGLLFIVLMWLGLDNEHTFSALLLWVPTVDALGGLLGWLLYTWMTARRKWPSAWSAAATCLAVPLASALLMFVGGLGLASALGLK